MFAVGSVECDGRRCSQLCVSDGSQSEPHCSCVAGYTPHPQHASRCVADPWALPGVLLVYNEASQVKAFNLSTLFDDQQQSHSRRLRSSTVLYTANRRIDAVGTHKLRA